MKIFCFLILLLFSLESAATTYYVSAEGSNQNDGLTMATALKSLGRVNAILSRLQPGDSLLFRRGDSFHGAMTINCSGNERLPIVIGSYGKGANPVINGFLSLNNWTPGKTGIYETTLPAQLTRPGVVLLNNKLQAVGRFPNAGTPNGGYLNFESHVELSSITDKDFTHNTNWTGAELVIRKNRWMIDRCKITAQAGSTFYYKSPTVHQPNDNFGYFIQNDIRTLDQTGEWYYDSTSRKFSMFFGTNDPANYKVRAAVIRTLLYCHGQKYITIENLTFEGANGKTLDIAENANHITVRNCNINYSGEYAVHGYTLQYFTIENCRIENSLNTALYIAPYTSGTIIRSNRISKTGLIPGMGADDNQALEGIVIQGQAPMVRNLVELNVIDSTGYIPISFLGDSVTVQKNFITNFCLTTDDGSGIYSSGDMNSKGRKVIDNIVLDGIGNRFGTNYTETNRAVNGIYMDDRTGNVEIARNTVARCCEHGIFLHNANNISVTGNTIYNCAISQIGMQQDSPDPIRNITVSKNILFAARAPQLISLMYSSKEDILQFGKFDDNYLYHPTEAAPVMKMISPSKTKDLNLKAYRESTGQQLRSVKVPVTTTGNMLFYYNQSSKDSTIKLTGIYKDPASRTYQNKVMLAPFTSLILIKSK
jgi:parallel beta-helix repeat protein